MEAARKSDAAARGGTPRASAYPIVDGRTITYTGIGADAGGGQRDALSDAQPAPVAETHWHHQLGGAS